MGIFGTILKTALDVVTVPMDVVNDITTFGEDDYTKDKISDIGEDLVEIKNELNKL